MASVTIRTSGVDLNGAELNNAATEETLQAILAESKLYNKTHLAEKTKKETVEKKNSSSMDKILASLGVIAKQVPGGELLTKILSKNSTNANESRSNSILGLENIGKTAEEGASGLTELFGAVEELVPELELAVGVMAVLKLLDDSLHAVINSVKAVSDAYFNGKVQLYDYTTAVTQATQTLLKDIPLIGGFLSGLIGVINKGIGIVTEWNTTWFALSTVGASFNNNLLEMRGAAARAGLTLTEFTGIIQANASVLANFGGTVTNGAHIFSDVSNKSLKQFGNSVMNLAGGFDAYTADLPDVIGLLAPNMESAKVDIDKLTASSVDLVTQMDAMSKLTGEARKAQLDQIKQAQNTAAYQMKYAEMSIDQRSRADMIMNESIQRFGPEIGGQVARMVALGTVPTTDALKMLTATTPGAIDAFKDMQTISNSTRGEISNFGKVINQNSVTAANAIGKTSKSFENILPYSEKLNSSLGGVVLANKRYIDANGQIQGLLLKDAKAAAEKEQSSRDNVKGALDQFTIGIRESFNSFFYGIIQPLTKEFTPTLQFISSGFQKAGAGIQFMAKWISDKIIGLVGNKNTFSITGIFNWIGAEIRKLWDPVISILTSVYNWAKSIKKQDIIDFGNNLLTIFKVVSTASAVIVGTGKVLGFASGTAGTGSVVRDFGRSTPTMLHGKEAVLTEEQMHNLVSNTAAAGSNESVAVLLPLLKSIDNKLSGMGEHFSMVVNSLTDISDATDKNAKHLYNILKATV